MNIIEAACHTADPGRNLVGRRMDSNRFRVNAEPGVFRRIPPQQR